MIDLDFGLVAARSTTSPADTVNAASQGIWVIRPSLQSLVKRSIALFAPVAPMSPAFDLR
jgi:hypothetical protein